MLGEGGFGTVVLAKGKLLGGPEQLYAIKAVKNRGISSSSACEIMTKKEDLMLTSGHPFITTLYSCFQNKDNIFFVMEFMSGGDLKEQLDEVEFGVTILHMIAGHPPFYYDEEEDWNDDNAQYNLDQKILNDIFDFPKHISLSAASIVLQILRKNPALRLGSNGSIDVVRQHSFSKGIVWQAVHEKRVEPPEKKKVAENPEEDTQSFSKVLKIDNSPDINNLMLFQGVSFITYGAKRGYICQPTAYRNGLMHRNFIVYLILFNNLTD